VEIKPLARPDAALVVAAVVSASLLPFVPWLAVVSIAVLLVAGWVRRCAPVVLLGVIGLPVGVLAVLEVMAMPLWWGVALMAVVIRFTPWLRGSTGWWRAGRLGSGEIVLALAISAVTAVALVVWQRVMQPDLADLVELIPAVHPVLIVVVGLLFASINALVEEVLYRGVLLDALDRTIGVGTAALLLQAVVFGLHHFEGFPRGWVGVGLATIYGLAMGVVRRYSGGLLAPWVAHVLADIAVYAILAIIAFGG
jgi:membrane protease YdiL (CAAX protease family)